ncbi:MAG: gamma carbonic anhydrase family protein [Burkholderiales bacterium]|nr:gamma carbonic anhydrase family protein [Burkholderiales bacterium]
MKYAIEDRRVVCKGDYYIAPGAIVVGSVILEHNVSIWFNCVVRADNELITLGEGSQIQDGSVLHTDPGAPIVFGKNVSVGHMAMIHGCTVGEGSLIGMGAILLNHCKIGKHSLVGAGTLITERKVFPDGKLILGSPGRVVRDLTAEEIERIGRTALNYQQRAKRYQAGFRPDDALTRTAPPRASRPPG